MQNARSQMEGANVQNLFPKEIFLAGYILADLLDVKPLWFPL
jgi:hypothetical protein